MAGHSKWKNIRRQKEATDAQRGKAFSRLIRGIKSAAKEGKDLDTNAALRNAVEAARSANMPKDVIERAIAGNADQDTVEAIVYEGYGPGGAAVLVECLSDNRNRTVGEVRHLFTKFGGNLGVNGSVAYLFTKKGILGFESGANEDQVLEHALEAGADDVRNLEEGGLEVLTSPDAFVKVKNYLAEKKLQTAYAEVVMEAAVPCEITDEETAQKLLKMLEKLEELDDVQQVYSNASVADELLGKT